MFHSHLLQVTAEQLEWLKKQPDFFDAREEFTFTNNICCSYRPEGAPNREIALEDYTLSLLMTSVQPPLEGWFSPEEMLFSRALVYGKQEIDLKQNLSYNSPSDVATIANELENLPLTSLRVIFEEDTVRFGNAESQPLDCNEEILNYQAALLEWVTEFYQSARANEYAVLIHWS